MVLHTYSAGCSFTPPMVEPVGVEPTSENPSLQLSPGAVSLLCFPLPSPADGIRKSVSF